MQVVQGGEPRSGTGHLGDLLSGGGVDRVSGLLGLDLDHVVDPGRGDDGLSGVVDLDRFDGLGQRDPIGTGSTGMGGWFQ